MPAKNAGRHVGDSEQDRGNSTAIFELEAMIDGNPPHLFPAYGVIRGKLRLEDLDNNAMYVGSQGKQRDLIRTNVPGSRTLHRLL